MYFIVYLTHKVYVDALNYLHEKANSTARLIDAIDATSQALTNHPEFETLQHIQALKNFKGTKKGISPKLAKAAAILRTNTFKGKPSIFSLKGRVKTAYALLKEVQNELVPALAAIGEIDAYLSCAALYNEYKDTPNHFVFAQYITQDTPYLCAQDIWNPFISAQKAVPNSITLDGNAGTDIVEKSLATPLNVILTGPNAGGKSTFLKGLTLNVLLAQTIGMVPARSLILTPFAKINTYMNITDDTAGGNSLFKSEVLRAQELLNTIENLPADKFTFSIMDEMFSGTSPKEGEAATYAVAESLGTHKNSILVLASHFQKLKDLEKELTTFKNYQVRVVRHADGTFSYPFKLEQGAADQNVAIDILKQQGFNSSILDRANRILDKQN